MNKESLINKIKMMFVFCGLIAMALTFNSCGDDDDDDDAPSVAGELVGTWTGTYTLSDTGKIDITMTFKSNGKCTIAEYLYDYPEESYKATLNYSVSGDLSTGATIEMSGRVDGEYGEVSYDAKIVNGKLYLENGYDPTLVLTKS